MKQVGFYVTTFLNISNSMFTKLRQLDSLKYEFHHAGKTSDCHGAAEIPIQFTWVFLKLSTVVKGPNQDHPLLCQTPKSASNWMKLCKIDHKINRYWPFDLRNSKLVIDWGTQMKLTSKVEFWSNLVGRSGGSFHPPLLSSSSSSSILK